ncbi:MAG: hypothetical protein AB7O26_18430 [Planctomycetaceae bacterium]
MQREPGLATYLIFPAIAMSLGWGLRGTIGGGPMGATIPGVMIALAICLLVRRPGGIAVAAALGTIGVGLGGQMTYGQTIGFVRNVETEQWGLLGLAVKGAVWGLSGGVLLGLGLVHEKFTRRQILIALLLMIGGTFLGWALVNQPKLIYFSNREKEPRAEIWAGLLFGAIATTGYLASLRRSNVPTSFALLGLIFGGLGFGGGGVFNKFGTGTFKENYQNEGWWKTIDQYVGWWKLMELTFGLLLGLGYGLAAWIHRKEIAQSDVDVPQPTDQKRSLFGVETLAAVGLSFVALWLQFHLRTPATFSILGSLLILIAVYSPRLAWQIAISFTVVAFLRDLGTSLSIKLWAGVTEDHPAAVTYIWIGAGLVSVAIAVLVDYLARRERLTAAWGFLFVTWAAVTVCFLKFFVPLFKNGLRLSELQDPKFVGLQSIFISCAIVLTVFAWRLKKADAVRA